MGESESESRYNNLWGWKINFNMYLIQILWDLDFFSPGSLKNNWTTYTEDPILFLQIVFLDDELFVMKGC